MKMTKQNEIKLANILVNNVKCEDDCYLRLTNSKKYGFYDFSFSFDKIDLRCFDQGTNKWECTTFVTEDEVSRIQPAFDKLREVLTTLDCVDKETEDEC